MRGETRVSSRVMRHLVKILPVLFILGILSVSSPAQGLSQAASEFLGGVDTSANTAGIATTTSFPRLIGNIISAILALVGIALVVILIYAGMLYMTAAGAAEKVETAKRMMAEAVIGIIIVLAAYAIATFVITSLTKAITFIPTAYAAGETLEGIEKAGSTAGFPAKAPTVAELTGQILNVILALTGILFTIILVWGGIMYLTASGDTERIATAKRMMSQSVIALIIIISAYAGTLFLFGQLAFALR